MRQGVFNPWRTLRLTTNFDRPFPQRVRDGRSSAGILATIKNINCHNISPMFGKFWRFLKTSSQNSNPSLPAIEVPPSAIDVEKDEGDEEVDSEAKMWFDRGNEQYNLGDFEGAIAFYNKALEFKPDDDAAWNNRGIALGKLGFLEEAILSYDKALEFK
ncbi:MAG: tetratricopeptide repeat protein [Microcoleus sp. SU_5_6]|nr:tetratricopeptide repeat protein [Microcoleus sp. SU_5_6]